MNFPLEIRFKLLALLSSKIYVDDASGSPVFFVKQKRLKLKEVINVFENENQEKLVATIKADRIIDFSATYFFATPEGERFGGVRRKGMRSLWKAHYDLLDGDGSSVFASLQEENAWIKVLDGLVSGIPIIGGFAGFFLNPSYVIATASGKQLLRIKKRPAFFEGKFNIEKLDEMESATEMRCVLSALMMLILERDRG